jgi:hypothetical protein
MDFSDQKIIGRIVDEAANTVSGMNEHGLANQLWALSARMRECVQLGHRYVSCTCKHIDWSHCQQHEAHDGV